MLSNLQGGPDISAGPCRGAAAAGGCAYTPILICRVEIRAGTTGTGWRNPDLGLWHAGWLYGRISRYYGGSQTAAGPRRQRRRGSWFAPPGWWRRVRPRG